jgi:catalase
VGGVGDILAYNWNFREDDADYYTQPGNLFRLMTPDEQQRLFDNTARAMFGVPAEIQQRWIGHCTKADPAYGAGVAAAVAALEGRPVDTVPI